MELLPLLLIFAVMLIPLLLMSSRQRKAQREQQERISRLGVGDEVRTHSGFYGLIVEEFEDMVVLESEDGTQTKWARQAIAMSVAPEDAAAEEDLADEDAAPADADATELPERADEDATGRPASIDDRAGEDSVPGVTVREDGTDPRTAR